MVRRRERRGSATTSGAIYRRSSWIRAITLIPAARANEFAIAVQHRCTTEVTLGCERRTSERTSGSIVGPHLPRSAAIGRWGAKVWISAPIPCTLLVGHRSHPCHPAGPEIDAAPGAGGDARSTRVPDRVPVPGSSEPTPCSASNYGLPRPQQILPGLS